MFNRLSRNQVASGLAIALVAFAGLTFTSGQFVPSPNGGGAGGINGGVAQSCAAGNFVNALSGTGLATCAVPSGAIVDNGTASKLAITTGPNTIGDYGSSTSSACAAGQAVTQSALSNVGALTTTCASFADRITPGLTIARAAQPGTVDASTQGTIDFFVNNCSGACGTNPKLDTNPHSLPSGGWILDSWLIDFGGLTGFTTQSDTPASGMTVSTDVGLDTKGPNMAASAVAYHMFSTTSPSTGWGYRFHVPCDGSQKVLRIYGSNTASVFRYAASVTDASSTSVTYDSDTVNSATTNNDKITITFTCTTGAWVAVTVTETARYGTSPGVYFLAATLAAS